MDFENRASTDVCVCVHVMLADESAENNNGSQAFSSKWWA